METKNNVLIIGLLCLILGFAVGYFMNANSRQLPKPTYTNMHGAMYGMTSSLSGKTGDEMDRAFLDGMVVHHEGAVEMAQTLLKETKRPELLKLGNDITVAQTQEIQMMKEWRKAWFNQ
ncbi:MAG: hypothetical protein A2937_02105 [Candidatus Yonathbacteria bacterium RIFCSPLOWO2_01_FULL_47_33b]|uniref:DUF305 domain-containing protein n=1 Tax=Candidatus Yonathbacteria bacterium RIFCSPLOWO2_01_FULL_47_33b TaxID=1802727 RepID=A0A1G2SGU3_9BACT|nr:MAG: hypothetical protein A2937_02105 [Candidatus Yonathbacteria bacterium RIFCSPLOWO2_01_FULL_47_33b]